MLGPEAHLLIVDVLQQRHDCPPHPRVTYLHVPYPRQYVWDDFNQQVGAYGVGFELAVISPIVDYMIGALPAERAAFYQSEHRRLLRDYAATASAWRPDNYNAAALYGALHRLEPGNTGDMLSFAKALRNSGKVENAQEVLAQAMAREPDNYRVHAGWADYGVAPFDWPEKVRRLRSLRAAFPAATEPRRLDLLIDELKILNDYGQWDEVPGLVEAHWADFTSHANLFQPALDVLIQLGCEAEAKRLMAEARAEVRAALPAGMLERIGQRLQAAAANRALLRRAEAQVLALGQNKLPGMLITRFGLREAPRRFEQSTPFDLGDFFGDAVAETLADDGEALLARADYAEGPAWGGGVILRHKPTGVAFMAHRAARISATEQTRTFEHLDQMVAHWRQVREPRRTIYLYVFLEKGSLSKLIEAARRSLLGDGSKLVIIDQHAEPTAVDEDADVIYLHAPHPKDFFWFSSLNSATAANLEYEERILAPVLELLNKYEFDAELALAPS